MAATKLAAFVLLYLTLSGHAFRHDLEKVTSALMAKATVEKVFKNDTLTTAMGSTPELSKPEQTAVMQFKQKINSFAEDPSMKWTGTGGAMATSWAMLSKRGKAEMARAMQAGLDTLAEAEELGQASEPKDLGPRGLDAMAEGSGELAAPAEAELVLTLQDGFTKWFKNQVRKHPQRPTYHHCKMNLLKVDSNLYLGDSTVDLNVVKEAISQAVESDTSGKECQFARKIDTVLSGQPKWLHLVQFFVGGRTAKNPKDIEALVTPELQEEASRVMEGVKGSLLHLSSYEGLTANETALEDLEAGSAAAILVILLIVAIIALFLCWRPFGDGWICSLDKLTSFGNEAQSDFNKYFS